MIRNQLFRFFLVGLMTVFIDYLFYKMLLNYFFLDPSISKGSSFIIGALFAFFVNRSWTFNNNQKYTKTIFNFFILYILTLYINIESNNFFLIIFNSFDFQIEAAFIIATSISAFLNFIGMKCFIFK